MRHNQLRLSRTHRAWFYGTFGVLFASGVAWWVLQHWGQQPGEFGPQPPAVQHKLLALHGGAAMLSLVILGTLGPRHIQRGWKARRNLPNGVGLIAVTLLLALTGYALYYSGNETLRRISSQAHIVLGLSLPLLIIGHIFYGRRTRPPQHPNNR